MTINMRQSLVASRLINWDAKFQCAALRYITVRVGKYQRSQEALRKVAQIPAINRLIPYFFPLGLDIWRLIEYPKCIDFLGQKKRGIILDIGSARTCFPSFLVKDGGKARARILTRN